jgi:hypothetical protein
MAVEYGLLDKAWVTDLSLVEVPGTGDAFWSALDEPSKLRMSLGLAWEAHYLPLLPGVIHQPGEMQCEGVYMTQDGESLDVVVSENHKRFVVAIHEVKVTYKSTRTVDPIEKNWLWMMQLKGYCRAKLTTRAYMHVLFVCGDYSHPIRPLKRIWQLDFTQQEIDEAWELMMSYRRHRESHEAENQMKDTI